MLHKSKKFSLRSASISAMAALLCGGVIESLPVIAAPKAPVTKKAESRPIAASAQPSANYRLGFGDGFRVVVRDFPEFNESVDVAPDGTVSLPYGTLNVSGKTKAQIEAQIRRLLLRELKNPKVAVIITKLRPLVIGSVYLIGSVASPGRIDIRNNYRLSEVLAGGGGLQGRVNERRATLTRGGQAPISLDLEAVLSRPNGPANLRVQPGDLITISEITPETIIVSGDVAQPGTYELHRNPVAGQREVPLSPRLSEVILAAGNVARIGTALTALPTADGAIGAAAPEYKGLLQRKNGEKIEVNVADALGEPTGPSNIRLRGGDTLTINLIPPQTIYVSGFVGRPGELKVAPGATISQVLTQAGGPTQPLEKVVARVRRGNEFLPVDLKAVQLQPDSKANFILRNGDVLELNEPEIIRVQVAGSVRNPGQLRLRPKATLLEALLEAGNLSIKPEEARLKVLRLEDDGTQRVFEADAVGLLDLSDVSKNEILREGDLVNVSQVKNQTIFLSGQIAKSGPYEIREGEGLPELITRAGGVTPDAALTRVQVQRGGQQIAVDTYDAITTGKALDFPLQQGDNVLIPKNENRVLLLESVGQPGYYSLPERGNLTLLDLIGKAGGTRGRTQEIILVRRSGNNTQKPQQLKIPIKEVRTGNAGQQILRSGDVIYVPEKIAKPGILNQLASNLGILRVFGLGF